MSRPCAFVLMPAYFLDKPIGYNFRTIRFFDRNAKDALKELNSAAYTQALFNFSTVP